MSILNVGAFLLQFFATRNGFVIIGVQSGVGERIRCDIQNPHYEGTIAQNEARSRKFPVVSFAHKKTRAKAHDYISFCSREALARVHCVPCYAGDGFSCGEMLGAGRTTPLAGAGVGFSLFGSIFGGRRSSSGWPAMSALISDASSDSRSSSASAIRINASRFSIRIAFARW